MEIADFGDPFGEYEAMENGAGLVDRSHLTKLRISGSDATDWLQGQVSNEMRNLQPGGSLFCLVCTPTGQIVADCSLWRLEDGFVMLASGSQRSALLERLERMLISEDVRIEDVTERFALLSLIGPEVNETWAEGRPYAPTNAVRGNGLDVLVPNEGEEDYLASLVERASPVGNTAHHVRRVEDGIPLYGAEMDARTLPQEMGTDFERDYISYTKGCYTGQEVIARIHSRGHTNRQLCGVRWEADVPPGARASMGGTEVGTITSSCRSFALGVPISLAVLRREAAEPGTKVQAEGVEGQVCNLPFVRR
jgi:folate-binding protein YgfZ